MEKAEVCFIRLYPDNPEDALIIAGLMTRKRKGEKSKIIKDILFTHFNREKTGRPELRTAIELPLVNYHPTEQHKEIIGPLSQLLQKSPELPGDDKETLKKNLEELSDMLM